MLTSTLSGIRCLLFRLSSLLSSRSALGVVASSYSVIQSYSFVHTLLPVPRKRCLRCWTLPASWSFFHIFFRQIENQLAFKTRRMGLESRARLFSSPRAGNGLHFLDHRPSSMPDAASQSGTKFKDSSSSVGPFGSLSTEPRLQVESVGAKGHSKADFNS
ncbi:hypothetical protein V8F06_005749 [Rhypophila decipiens]